MYMDNDLRSRIIARALFRDFCMLVLMENGLFINITKFLIYI
jgi:hypothetical protein